MDKLKADWKKTLARLRIKVSTAGYDTWIQKLTPFSTNKNIIVLTTPYDNVKRTVLRDYNDIIIESMKEARVFYDDFDIILNSEIDEYIADNKCAHVNLVSTTTSTRSQFVEKFTFDNYILGDFNEHAEAAAQSVVENPSSNVNPLYIYGGTGLGKTHLLHSIGHALESRYPNLNIILITAEQFMNELINSIRTSSKSDDNKKFRSKYYQCDVLIIDDIQFLIGKTSTQETIFYIFNELYNKNSQIILSSDKPPAESNYLEERLASRFASGIITEIVPPKLEDRIAILHKRANDQKFKLNNEILTFIADQSPNNIRILESMLNNVIFYAKLENYETIDIPFAKKALKFFIKTQEETVTIDNIIETTSNYFNLDKNDMIGKRKNKDIVYPRQIAIYIVTQMIPSLPLSKIGQAFGGRDHTTIMHARDKIGKNINDRVIDLQIKDIKNLIFHK